MERICADILCISQKIQKSLGSRHTEQSLQSIHLLLHTDPCVAMQRLSCSCREPNFFTALRYSCVAPRKYAKYMAHWFLFVGILSSHSFLLKRKQGSKIVGTSRPVNSPTISLPRFSRILMYSMRFKYCIVLFFDTTEFLSKLEAIEIFSVSSGTNIKLY